MQPIALALSGSLLVGYRSPDAHASQISSCRVRGHGQLVGPDAKEVHDLCRVPKRVRNNDAGLGRQGGDDLAPNLRHQERRSREVLTVELGDPAERREVGLIGSADRQRLGV
jgi:hypothetical protein